MATMYPPVVVVDENDNEIGSAMTAEVWQKGLYHRIVTIFVFDDKGRTLLQLRGPSVKLYPGRWDQAAGGHVDEGRSYEQAAADEITEELGLHNMTLTAMGTHRINTRDGEPIINQFERVYSAYVPHNVSLKSGDASEVSSLTWFTPAKLKKLIAEQEDKITPGLLEDLRRYFPNFIA